MPASQVTVGVTYVKADETTEQPSTKTFSDVSSSDWFADAVKYVSDKGMMNGTGNGKFSPADSTTRGMLMTVIARYAGEDTTGSNPWYQKGMEWAKANGVSDGTAPNANITREQLREIDRQGRFRRRGHQHPLLRGRDDRFPVRNPRDAVGVRRRYHQRRERQAEPAE